MLEASLSVTPDETIIVNSGPPTAIDARCLAASSVRQNGACGRSKGLTPEDALDCGPAARKRSQKSSARLAFLARGRQRPVIFLLDSNVSPMPFAALKSLIDLDRTIECPG